MANVYNNAKEQFLSGNTLDLDDGAATYKVLLLKSGVAIDYTDVFVADLTPGTNEISVAGYARQTLTGRTVTQDDVNHRGDAAATKVTFSSLASGQTIGAAVIFKDLGADASSLLVSYYDLTDTATNGGDFTILWDSGDPSGDFLRLQNA